MATEQFVTPHRGVRTIESQCCHMLLLTYYTNAMEGKGVYEPYFPFLRQSRSSIPSVVGVVRFLVNRGGLLS